MTKTRYRSLIILLGALLVSACSGDKQGDNTALITVSTGNGQVLASHDGDGQVQARKQALLAAFTRIMIQITDETGNVHASGDLKQSGGTLSMAVPANTALSIIGAAYENGTLVYESHNRVAPLTSGASSKVTLTLLPVGALTARVVPAPIQVDITAQGVAGDNLSGRAVFRHDNREVLFHSLAGNLVESDGNGFADVFIKDLVADSVVNVHTHSDGTPGNGDLLAADMSQDGNVVVFASQAGNLVSDDQNGVSDIFLKNIGTGDTVRLSLLADGGEVAQGSIDPSVSADGLRVALRSAAALTGTGETGIFLVIFDGAGGRTLRHVAEGVAPQLSADGNWLTYHDPVNGALMLYDVAMEEIREIVRYQAAEPPHLRISADGRFVVFATVSRFDPVDTDESLDIYRYDRVDHSLNLLSTDRSDTPLPGDARLPSLSNDGRFVVYVLDGVLQIKDAQTGEAVALPVTGSEPEMSPDGQLLAYVRSDDNSLFVAANPLRVQAPPDISPQTPGKEPVPGLSYRLTVTKQGNGSVASDDGTINCGSACSRTYSGPSTVELLASADAGHHFVGWSGACTGTAARITVNVSGTLACRALFAADVVTFAIGGSITGLGGSGLVLRNNGGDDLPISANGVFRFATESISGNAYQVTVAAQPSLPNQMCTVTGGTGMVADTDITDITVSCVTSAYTVGGTVAGMTGVGLVLRNNGGDDLSLSANGEFVFTLPVTDGAAYNVSVLTQPAGPAQLCNLVNGGGVVVGANVTNIQVNCITASTTHTVNGTVTGLQGSGLVLQNNGSDNLSITGNGTFTFTTPLPNSSSYAVSVLISPGSPSQTCLVSNGNGTLSGADVTDVTVSCSTNSFTVGGTVSGYTGSGLVLQNNSGDDLPIGGDGSFTFSSALLDGAPYTVTVLTQPSAPTQVCAISNGSGVLAGAAITNIAVTCDTTTYTIGGTVSGLAGGGLVLQNNGGDNLSVLADGGFIFKTPIADSGAYAVTVLSQPTQLNQTCTVTNGSGTVNGAAVGNVVISCVTLSYTIGGTLSGLAGSGLVLRNNGGNDLSLTANGPFQFSVPLVDGTGYQVTLFSLNGAPGESCIVSSASGTVAGAAVTDVSVTCATNVFSVGGTVSGLTGSGLVLRNNGGDDHAIDTSGPFTFPAAIANGGTYNVSVASHPEAPYQICSVTNGSGTVSGAAVNNVDVGCVAGMVINNFTATPSTITVGGSATLSIDYANAGGVIDNGIGAVNPVSQAVVTPGATTTYTLVVTDAVGRSLQQSQQVTVVAAPAISSFSASSLTITAGGSVQLTAVFSNGTGSIDNGVDAVLSGTPVTVTPAATTTYRLTVTNAAGTKAIQDLTITVNPSAALASLTLSAGSLDQMFQPNQLDYTAALGYLTQSLQVTAVPQTAGATVTVNGTILGTNHISPSIALVVGVNPVINITVSPQLGVQQQYWLTVTRQAANAFAKDAYLKANNSRAFDNFGNAVAVSGNTVAVGSRWEDTGGSASGAVYVFVYEAGVWRQEAFLKASNPGVNDYFGGTVDLWGDTLVVGASGEDSSATGINGDQLNDNTLDSGAVYVFTRSAGVWQQQAYIKASNTGSRDSFGYPVAVSGDTLAVGAWSEDSDAVGLNGDQTNDNAASSGAAYVFVRAAGVWSQQAYVKASNTGSTGVDGDRFGFSLDLDGDTLAVGAEGEGSNATGVNGDQLNNLAPFSGAVYVYTRSGTLWQQQAYIKASNTQTSDVFGASVALSGDTLAVGAHNESSGFGGVGANQTDNSVSQSGAVYVFSRTAGNWSQQAYIKASNPGIRDLFSRSLDIAGDVLVVGADSEDSSAVNTGGDQLDNNAADAGAVYVFLRDNGIWSQRSYVKASNTDVGDMFGSSVKLSSDTLGNILVVGAPRESSNAKVVNGDEASNAFSQAGAAYIFR